MLKKLLLTAFLSVFLALPVIALAGGGGDLDNQPQQHIGKKIEKNDGLSSEVLAALIAGGLGLCGVVITTVVAVQNRRK